MEPKEYPEYNRNKRSPGLEGPESIIRKTMHSFTEEGKGQELKFYQHWVLWHWPEIVGPFISRNCEPQGIRKGVLYLYCQNASLRNELQMMRLRMIECINNFAGQQMVQEVQFTRRWEQPDSAGIADVRLAQLKRAPNIGAERRRMGLTPRDLKRAQEIGAQAQDKEIGAKVQEIYRKSAQMRKLKLQKGWHPCEECGRLTEPGSRRCFACDLEHKARVVADVRRVLMDIPWARCAEVQEYVPECTPKLLNYQRALLVQRLAAEVELKDFNSLKAKNLVMLYRCLPPEQLNEEVIKRALYDLRNNLHKPKDYKAPRRYEFLSWGKKKKEGDS